MLNQRNKAYTKALATIGESTMINRVLQAKKEIDRINKKFADGIEELIPSEIESFCSFSMIMNTEL